jgi:aldehyde dehydrogenase (NAD+)
MVPSISEYVYEPYGVCLIIGAFNYPLDLVLGPLLGAIAAGNCVFIKPSELSTNVEQLIQRLLPIYLDMTAFSLICGGKETTSCLLSKQWDHIFFTGSPKVGKIVAKAAAEYLTPVTLELGGKSPVIIDESVTDLELAAKRILWGKFVNAGQTCIAPDYLLIHESHYEAFITISKKIIDNFYGNDPKLSDDYSRIISTFHCERIKNLIKDSNCNIVKGGDTDIANKYIAPTLVTDVDLKSKIMIEEIFGPVLPIIKIKEINEAIQIINSVEKEKPLALYIFGKNRTVIDKIISEVPSGGVLVNDVMLHFANSFIPFGGIGRSGVGSYHGKFSFECFCRCRGIMRKDDHSILDIPFRYPPYSSLGTNIIKLACKLPAIPHISTTMVINIVIGAIAFLTYPTWSNFLISFKFIQ